METKLTKILSLLTLVGAWAYSLGWIRTSYYFRSFGIGLESVEYSPQDYLFASWYTVENVMFFVLLWWVAAMARKKWVYVVAALYLPLPYLTDLSYSHLSSPTWGWLFWLFVSIPHSILKFVPFLILGAVIMRNKEGYAIFKESSWPHGNFALVALSIAAIAWSISAAKHFGTSDANNILRDPAKTLLHVKLRVLDGAPNLKPIETRQSIYLLYYSAHRCILLDTTGFTFGQSGAHFTILYVPPEKIEMIDGLKNADLDPGRLLW